MLHNLKNSGDESWPSSSAPLLRTILDDDSDTPICHEFIRRKDLEVYGVYKEKSVGMDSSELSRTGRLEQELAAILQRVPPFIRLPKRNKFCPYTGLSRSSITHLVVPCRRNDFKPPVEAVPSKQPNSKRGIWLIPSERLFRFLLTATGSNIPGLKLTTDT